MSIDLMAAIIAGNATRTNELLESGADPNFRHKTMWHAALDTSLPAEFLPHFIDLRHPSLEDSEFAWTWTPLLLACVCGEWSIAQSLLDLGAQADYADETGYSPLLCTTEEGQMELVRTLLSAGADVNRRGPDGATPIMAAAGLGRAGSFAVCDRFGRRKEKQRAEGNPVVAMTEKFWSGKFDLPEQRVESTIDRHSHLDILHALLDAGADPDLRDDEGGAALINACSNGWVDAVQILLHRGASVDCEGRFGGCPLDAALMGAAGKSLPLTISSPATTSEFLACAELLIEHGADVNRIGHWGHTPLRSCIFDIDSLRFLLDRGADPNSPSGEHGQTVLFLAAERDLPESIRVLVERGAEVDRLDEQDRTPLMIAAWNGQARAVQTLLELGADLTLRSKGGNTALMAANLTGRPERMLSKLQQMSSTSLPMDSKMDELWSKIDSLREQLGERGKDLPTREQRDENMSAFYDFMRRNISEQKDKEESGRAECIRILKGAGATE